MFHEGKAAIFGELARVFERLGSNTENWLARLQKRAAGRLLGRFFAASRARLREVAERLGVHHWRTWAAVRRDEAAQQVDSRLLSISRPDGRAVPMIRWSSPDAVESTVKS